MRLLVTIAMTLSFAVDESAQTNSQQTPANARLFLSRLTTNGSTTIGFHTRWGDTWNGVSHCETGCRIDEGPDQPLKGLEWSNPCQVVATFNFSLPSAYTWGMSYALSDRPLVLKYDVDWGKTADVKVVGNAVELAQTPTFRLRLVFASADLAARAALAMEVIRASCDATAGTGF